MKYLDTSIAVSALTVESTTAAAIAWLGAQDGGSLSSSGWMTTEFSAALSRKIRMSRLSVAEVDRAMMRFNAAILPGLTMLQVDTAAFVSAAEIAIHYDAGIRSGDALHLAIASAYGHVLCTFDKSFTSGAASLGYPIELIS